MVNFPDPRKMSVSPNTKLILSGATLLVVIVSCSVAVARGLTNDTNNVDDSSITSAKIVNAIRDKMKGKGAADVPIQAYIVPSTDAHQSEYVAEQDNRIKYISKFTGTSGTAVITETAALLWTDSRYHVQAENQIDKTVWTLMKEGLVETPTVLEWLIDKLPPNSRVGINKFLIKAADFRMLSDELGAKGRTLVAIPYNLVDLVWGSSRPKPKLNELEIVDRQFSGKSVREKVDNVREALQKMNADCHVVSALDEIAWLLNLRGSDKNMTPVFFSYVIITQTTLSLYLLEEKRYTDKIYNHFYKQNIIVNVDSYSNTTSAVYHMARSTTECSKVLLSSASLAIQSEVPSERLIEDDSPILKMQIIKNENEAEGMKRAHTRDGAALIKYLHWLDTEIDGQSITETKGAEKLKSFRSQNKHYRGLSFPTISAVGLNAAIVHYAPTDKTEKQITRNEIYLVNSGAQYSDGTTDITRTIHFGEPTKEEINAFTRALKGFISLATAVFPPGAPFSFFDAMARRSLWDVGLNYEHPTGHGIGAYLNVHETPPIISSVNSSPGMMKNMFMSNEPGYYEKDKFGVRIGNILQVIDTNQPTYFNGAGAYKFEDVSMAPIQIKLIDIDLLTDNEIKWLNDYHKKVREKVTPLLANNSNVVDWLVAQTEPIREPEKPTTEDATKATTTTTTTTATEATPAP